MAEEIRELRFKDDVRSEKKGFLFFQKENELLRWKSRFENIFIYFLISC